MRLIDMKKLTQKQQDKIYKKIFFKNGLYVVLIDVSEDIDLSKTENNSNVYLVDNNYKIIWQISADDTTFDKDMFTSIELIDREVLVAKRFSGFKYKIDPQTGKAEQIGWDK
jgi:ribonuclease HII